MGKCEISLIKGDRMYGPKKSKTPIPGIFPNTKSVDEIQRNFLHELGDEANFLRIPLS